eukprot:4723287-Amphidinium_carterae.1
MSMFSMFTSTLRQVGMVMLEGIWAAATRIYVGPRRVCYHIQMSGALRATAGILAGCSQATSWSKLNEILAPTMRTVSAIEP